jgi:NADPH:quinone reductase-like Zn-dependent oxidoreductase
MRQVVIPRHGGPDVLELRDGADPVPGPGQVRIRVRAAGVNFADLLARMGLYPAAPAPPMVAGYEVAGAVDGVGPGVNGIAAGDRVLALTNFGGYSDVVVTPAGLVFRAPEGLSDAEAAAIPVNYLTALLALYKIANVTAGETVVVMSAGGGVGIAAAQLARLRRARIIGSASAHKHEALRAMGIDHLIDARTDDVQREVTRMTNGRGADIVLDGVGGRSYATSYRLLAPLGRLIMFGVSSIAPGERRSWLRTMRGMFQMPRFSPLSLINRNRGVFGLNLAHLWQEREQLLAAMDMLLKEFDAGRLRPILARTFPLDRAADAHRFIHSRANIGKVVLTT